MALVAATAAGCGDAGTSHGDADAGGVVGALDAGASHGGGDGAFADAATFSGSAGRLS